ncbi:hypothetical protein GCM10011578_052450 [Streptomyces fuscichromogenes]|uniref:Uncharacterized protein n=1 Tax=Streptomyces fuscichromogenes TaxID=1324013 RepID=A0A917XFT8_9ACTN|nr:hypothetical protein GCM10011578_052450 [Streptomyces fuscichromogenes]
MVNARMRGQVAWTVRSVRWDERAAHFPGMADRRRRGTVRTVRSGHFIEQDVVRVSRRGVAMAG